MFLIRNAKCSVSGQNLPQSEANAAFPPWMLPHGSASVASREALVEEPIESRPAWCSAAVAVPVLGACPPGSGGKSKEATCSPHEDSLLPEVPQGFLMVWISSGGCKAIDRRCYPRDCPDCMAPAGLLLSPPRALGPGESVPGHSPLCAACTGTWGCGVSRCPW